MRRQVREHTATMGQHDEEILAGELGLDASEREEFRGAGDIAECIPGCLLPAREAYP